MKRATKTVLLVAVAALRNRRSPLGRAPQLAWDTCKRFSGGNVDLNKRDGWQPLAPRTSAHYAFKGDAVIENDKLQVLFSAGCGGAAGLFAIGRRQGPQADESHPLKREAGRVRDHHLAEDHREHRG